MHKPTAVILDLDFTLAHFDGGYERIYETLAPLGLPRYEAKDALQKAVAGEEGFNFQRYIQIMEAEGLKADWDAVAKALDELFKSTYVFYPDVLGFLSAVRERSIPLVLVTAGNTEFQQSKIDQLGFQFDDVFITSLPKWKGDAIYKIQQRTMDHVWFIDDKRRELTRVFDTPKVKKANLTLFEMDRPDAAHRETKKDPKFTPITSLTSLIQYL